MELWERREVGMCGGPFRAEEEEHVKEPASHGPLCMNASASYLSLQLQASESPWHALITHPECFSYPLLLLSCLRHLTCKTQNHRSCSTLQRGKKCFKEKCFFFFCLLNHVRSIYQTQFQFILIREWKGGWEITENVSPLLSCQSPVTSWSRKMSCWLKAFQIMIPHAHRHTCTQVCHLGTSRYLICFIFTISSLFSAFLCIVFQIKETTSRFMGTLQVHDTWAGCL